MVDYMTCDKESWPMCLLDFTFQARVSPFMIYKVRDFPGHIVEDHFYPVVKPHEIARQDSMAFSQNTE